MDEHNLGTPSHPILYTHQRNPFSVPFILYIAAVVLTFRPSPWAVGCGNKRILLGNSLLIFQHGVFEERQDVFIGMYG